MKQPLLAYFRILTVDCLPFGVFELSYVWASDDEGWAIQQTSDGGCILGGCPQSFITGDYDLLAIKTDYQGTTEWFQAYVGTSNKSCSGILITPDGDIYYENYDSYLAKMDNFNAIKWGTRIPTEFKLTAYPNPLNSGFNIETLPHLKISIFNFNENEISSDPIGTSTYKWQPVSSLGSGLYIIKPAVEIEPGRCQSYIKSKYKGT